MSGSQRFDHRIEQRVVGIDRRAPLLAHARHAPASACAVSKPTWRGDGGKNTKPTMSAPASSATSSASGVERPQILTIVPTCGIRPGSFPSLAFNRRRRSTPRANLACGGRGFAAGPAAGPQGASRLCVRAAWGWPVAAFQGPKLLPQLVDSRSNCRAIRRHLPCRSHDAKPPISTPTISRRMTSANSGSFTAAAGSAALNGSTRPSRPAGWQPRRRRGRWRAAPRSAPRRSCGAIFDLRAAGEGRIRLRPPD